MPTKTTKRVSKKEALTSCGTHLKPGYKYVKGGGVVKVTAKAPAKKAAPKKRGLGAAAKTCVRLNPDGSRTIYTGQGGGTPCPYGGTLNGAAPKKKPAAKKKITTKRRVVKRK